MNNAKEFNIKMSYSIIDNAMYWKVMGNTIIYKDLFKSFGGIWDSSGWIFNKNTVTKENFDIMISKTNSVTPLMLSENESYYIIKGNTTPFKEDIKAAGGKWINSFWGFKKTSTEERTFTKEYVENVILNLINKKIPMNIVVKNIPVETVDNKLLDKNNPMKMTDNDLSKMSDNELREELTKALEYVKKIKEIMKKRIDDE